MTSITCLSSSCTVNIKICVREICISTRVRRNYISEECFIFFTTRDDGTRRNFYLDVNVCKVLIILMYIFLPVLVLRVRSSPKFVLGKLREKK